jgi:ADP-heptose:LPS heptosyltransferase
MARHKNTGLLKRLAFGMLGRKWGRILLSRIVLKHAGHLPPLSFPIDAAAVKRALMILPPEPIASLHQLKNIAALKALLRNAETKLLAEASCTEIAGMIEDVTIIEYRREEKRLFSSLFGVFNRSFRGTADVCFLLVNGDDLPLLYCCGRTAAPLRIGYAGAYPFVNLHVNPSPERRYLTDRNFVMAETLGAEGGGEDVLPSTVQAKAEIDHLISGISRKSGSRPVGIDAFCFFRAFGARRAAEIIRALLPVVKNAAYLYADETPDASEMDWLSGFNLPLMHHLTVTQLRALLFRSEAVVTGNTLMFGLAAVLGSKAVGVFHKSELDTYCPVSGAVRGVAYEKIPDEVTVRGIKAALAGLS